MPTSETTLTQRPKLVLIDANSLIHRAFHALPPLSSTDGLVVGAVYGFTSMLLRVLEDINPEYIAVAWDTGAPTFRHKQFDDYKGHREEMDDQLRVQFPLVKELVTAFNIPQFSLDGFEADDIIGTLAVQGEAQGVQPIIVTGDTDALQLVNDCIRVYMPRKGFGDTILYDKAEVKAKYEGLVPVQLVDYRALKGDSSDNIPGVKGIGEKTATTLLLEYKTLDDIYDNVEKISTSVQKKLLADRENAYMSLDLARIRTDAPISLNLPATKVSDYDQACVLALFQRFSFKSLVDRLPAADGASQASLFNFDEIVLDDEKSDDEFDVYLAEYVLHGLTGSALTLSSLAFSYLGYQMTDETTLSEDEEKKLNAGIRAKQEHELDLPENKALKGLLFSIEIPLKSVLKRMQDHGVLLDREKTQRLANEYGDKITQLEKEIYADVGHEFNINSPKQLQDILFDELKLPVVKKTKTGRSTDESVLSKLVEMHPVIQRILDYRGYAKIKSTYLDALPLFVDEQGRIHTTYNQTVAASGRLSSENPNLQNIPIGDGVELRTLFVAPKGYTFLVADYSQIELRIMAHITNDEYLISSFEHNQDVHASTAARIFDTTIDKVTYDQRKVGKTINFALMYGMGEYGLSESLSIPVPQAKQYIDRFFANYPQVKAWQEKHLKESKGKGYVETLYGRRRPLPDLASKNFFKRSAAERIAINHPLQGTQADLIKMAMITIDNHLQTTDLDAHMILQVHDELVFEVRDDQVEQLRDLVCTEMEGVAELRVPIKVGIEVGNNWGETVEVS